MTPGIKTLRILGLNKADTAELRRTLKSADTVSGFNHKAVDEALDYANSLLKGHSIESIRGPYVDRYHQDINLVYVNLGDPYYPTVIFDTLKQRFVIDGWGDIVERESKRFAQGDQQ